jgi:hypothetical protein
MCVDQPTDGCALVYSSESVRNMKTAFFCFLLVTAAAAEIHQNPGGTTPLPHQKYIHVVSEADSPIQQTYIKSKDGLYIAAAIRKPKGDGRYPAIIIFHGAPGGRGMEQLVGWSRGDHGGPVWERRMVEPSYVIATCVHALGATVVPQVTEPMNSWY